MDRTERNARSGCLPGFLFLLVVMAGVLVVTLQNNYWPTRMRILGGRPLGSVSGSVVFTAEPERGGDATVRLVPAGGGTTRTLVSGLPGNEAPVLSPDGTRMAWLTGADDRPVLHTTAVPRKGAPLRIPLRGNSSTATDSRRIAWSPDGRHIAFIADLQPGRVDSSPTVNLAAATGDRVTTLGPAPRTAPVCVPGRCFSTPAGGPLALVWLPDGDLVYEAERSPSGAGVYRLTTDGSEPRLVASSSHGMDLLAVSPDGRHVLYGQAYGASFVLDLSTGRSRELSDKVSVPSFSPDGKRLLFAYRDRKLKIAAADGTGVRTVGHMGYHNYGDSAAGSGVSKVPPSFAVWSPDGRHLAVAGSDNYRWVVSVMNPDGTGQQPLYSFDGTLSNLRWLP